MSAPLPPLHALAIVHRTPRIRPAHPIRQAQYTPALGRLWSWLMAPIDHGGQPTGRAQLLARVRQQEHACLQAAAQR